MKGLSTGSFVRRILSGNAFNRYKEAFDMAGFAIMLIDNRTNRFIKANKAAAELFGYTRAELLKMTPMDLSTEPEAARRVLKEKSKEPTIRPARTKDGKIIIVRIQTRYSDRFHVSLISDVTEEYRIRRALELNEERLREAQRIGRFGWWEYRPETNKYFGSEELLRIYNDEVTDKTFSFEDQISLVHPEDRSYVISGIDDAIEKKLESCCLI